MGPLEQRVSLRHLRLVEAIEREGSLSRAAERLHMTQSAVTKALQEVEALTGEALFRRTNRGTVATACGQMLVHHARTIAAQLRQADRALWAHKSGAGIVAVGALPSAAGGLLPRAIVQALADTPQLQVAIAEGDAATLTTRLRRAELDLVVGRLPRSGLTDDLAHEALGSDRVRLVVRAAHPLAHGGGPLTLERLRACRWILPAAPVALREQVDAAFRAAGVAPPEPAVESMSFLCNRALLLGADFVTAWPEHLAQVEAANGSVVILPVEVPGAEQPLGLWWLRGTGRSPAAAALVGALRDCFAALDLAA